MSDARIRQGFNTLLATALFALAACAAPSATTPATAGEPAPTETAAEPAQPDAVADGTVQIDRSCRTDADCTVKNVGNCCGYYPACVSVDSPTDPEGVRAACAKSGRMSVCGFREIQGCQCVEGRCKDSGASTGGVQIK